MSHASHPSGRKMPAAILAVLATMGTRGHADWRRGDGPVVVPGPMAEQAGLVLGRPLPGAELRELYVEPAEIVETAPPGATWLAYDPEELTRAVSFEELAHESELSVAVRLIVSEVGADRLVASRFGFLEAVGILYTVRNRMDPLVRDPQNRPESPDFSGCGPDGSFAACANAQQYLGMATWRALDPGSRYPPAVLEAATDLSVLAWWLQKEGYVGDLTQGATNYVHRCGGAGYGLTTPHCDAHLGAPAGDVPGANPHTGPIVFRAPEVYLPRVGYYTTRPSRWVDYEPWLDDQGRAVEELAEIRAEAGLDAEAAAAAVGASLGLTPHAALQALAEELAER